MDHTGLCPKASQNTLFLPSFSRLVRSREDSQAGIRWHTGQAEDLGGKWHHRQSTGWHLQGLGGQQRFYPEMLAKREMQGGGTQFSG